MKTRTPIRPVVVKPKSYALHLLVVALLWSLAMTMDYHDQAAAAEEEKAEAVGQLLDCMNGKAQWIAEDGTEIGCMKAVTNKRGDRNVR